MEKIKLYEEFKLIEKTEPEVNGAWKGAHLLLFFMAFVFGAFCTFCFHMIMYLFDDKCVLFPKLLSLTSLRHNLIYEFIPDDKMAEMLPVDFLSTQWIDKSACYLPTYVPLLSGIFGLVWTTMFLMCSASSRTLTGLQRPWRVLPPVFVFSLLMGSLCVYSSTVTQYGLEELCLKLGEITGSTTCTYTVNVATLAYERRIRGVYQATQLTVASAWLHTACWLLSALLALIRVLLAVDFHLVRVTVYLQGDIDKMLQKYERHVRTVTPDYKDAHTKDYNLSYSVTKVHFKKTLNIDSSDGTTLYLSRKPEFESQTSLVPDEKRKLLRLSAYEAVSNENKFIVKLLYDILDRVDLTSKSVINISAVSSDSGPSSSDIVRQFGQERIKSAPLAEGQESVERSQEFLSIDLHENEEIYVTIRNSIIQSLNKIFDESESDPGLLPEIRTFPSVMNITSDMKLMLEAEKTEKQPDENVKKGEENEFVDDENKTQTETDPTSNTSEEPGVSNVNKKNKKPRKKEKQD